MLLCFYVFVFVIVMAFAASMISMTKVGWKPLTVLFTLSVVRQRSILGINLFVAHQWLWQGNIFERIEQKKYWIILCRRLQ